WSVISNAEWIIPNIAQGVGNGVLQLNLSENKSDSTRITRLEVAFGEVSKIIEISQIAPLKLISYTDGETTLTDSIHLIFNRKVQINYIRSDYPYCIPIEMGRRTIENGKGVRFKYACATLGLSYPFSYSVTDEHDNTLTDKI